MASRGRTRRHGSAGSNSSGMSSSKVIRLGLVVVLMSSALYLFCTHTLVSRQHDSSNGSSRDGRLGYNPPDPKTGVPIYRPGDPHFDYGNQVVYEEDPRNPGGVRRSEVEGAQSPMDYVELRCEGGKKPDVDLSYWKDIPADKAFESPWGASARKARESGLPQYVTFEPDHGGFNNIRMAMETVLVFARQTGRTLVMPPAQKFYLLTSPAVEFADMFPIEDLSAYMEVVSMEDFLEREGVTGKLGIKPPDNKSSGHSKGALENYLRSVADVVPQWNHMEQALLFGPSPGSPSIATDDQSQAWHSMFLTDKRSELKYTEEMQQARHIHFRTSGSRSEQEYRLFTHFYTFLGFTDPVASRHHRRLVRDVVHFREGLFCAAAIITARLRAAGNGHPGRWSGWYGEWGGLGEGEGEGGAGAGEGGALRKAGFSTFHIRRGDFQYVKMKPPATTILSATKDLVRPGEVLYIATDERDKSFFDPFLEDHRVFFLDDFKDALVGIDPSYYLMIDTIVASQGRSFIGTWRSTFTGYITRLRGYYRYPTEFSWYFWDESKKDYRPLSLNADTVPRSPFFMREWPNAWEGIDEDLWPQ